MTSLQCHHGVPRRVITTAFTIILLGAIILVAYKSVYSNEKITIYFPEVVGKNKTAYVYSHPKCEQNMAAAEVPGFDTLVLEMKDYLYYRHCRHFPMILDIPDKCGGADHPEDIFLLLVIKTPPMNFDRRDALRKTWAEERLHKGRKIRRVFISGKLENDKTMNDILKQEQQKHNDILQWDFRDSFHNLTLKQVLFLDWLNRNCAHVRFVLNGDDDVLANTDNIVEYLDSLSNNDGKSHLFTGNVHIGSRPVRQISGRPGNKYAVPVQVYEPKIYPPYCSGGGFILSGYTAFVIYRMSDLVPLMPIDDAYMGMCLAKANLNPTDHQGVKMLGIPPNSFQVDPCKIRDQFIVHKISPMNIIFLWDQVHDPKLQCGTQKGL